MRAFDGFGGHQTAEAAFPLDFQRLPDPNQLGDVGNSDPSLWWHQEFETGRVHLTVHLYSSAAEGLAAAAELRASAIPRP